MIEERPQADRILVAQLTGEARFRAKWRELTGDEEATAVAALRELAGGRADLLAEVAGVLEGASAGELDEPLARQAAALCKAAGADLEAVPAWIAEGRRRRDAARLPPFSGGVRSRPPSGGLAVWVAVRIRLPWGDRVGASGRALEELRKSPPCSRSVSRTNCRKIQVRSMTARSSRPWGIEAGTPSAGSSAPS